MAKNLEIALLFDFYGDMLTDKQRDVVELYYDNDLSLSEIAENEGITPPRGARFHQARRGPSFWIWKTASI